MAEMRRHAADHRYESDDQIIQAWVRSAELGMQVPTWELKWFAKLFREMRESSAHETTEPIVETTAAHWLGELLAVIHRDGGHYEGKHGAIVATQDAIKIVHVLRGDRNCKVCDGLGYSVGVAKRVTCDECDGTGLALLAEHSSPLEPTIIDK